ncbi:MAG: tryptophan--tRNA ligase, partial [Alphaproteobacteria bacterium]|nr:tryptophan--tRNA ligase [Alphaproteobacteria bacterium]
DVLQDILGPIRARREELARDPAAVMKILEDGTARARKIAAATNARVKRAMKLDYFN